MNTLQRFFAYAGDFEKTLADDDWTRLRRYFADDAVYEVKSSVFGCRLVGPSAIFAGMKKSLDGFDRRFDRRDAEVTDGPTIDGDAMQFAWKVVYHLEGQPSFTLYGRSTVRYQGDLIVSLCDAYDDTRVSTDFAAWQRQTGLQLDPSYT